MAVVDAEFVLRQQLEAIRRELGLLTDVRAAIAPCIRPPLYEVDIAAAIVGQLREAVASEDSAGMHETFTRAKAARDEFAAILAERGQGKQG